MQTAFIERVGRRLFRRSLTGEELDARVAIASAAAKALGDFYAGLEIALASLLVSPDFLFRIEEAEPDPADPSTMRLTSVAMASRLSYLLWNTTPDDDLIAAGENGDLVDENASPSRSSACSRRRSSRPAFARSSLTCTTSSSSTTGWSAKTPRSSQSTRRLSSRKPRSKHSARSWRI